MKIKQTKRSKKQKRQNQTSRDEMPEPKHSRNNKHTPRSNSQSILHKRSPLQRTNKNYKKENYMTKVADFDRPSEIHCWRCDETADLVMIMNKIDNKYSDIPIFLCTHHYLIEHRNVSLTP